jgi:hypothetical protein
MGPDSIGRNATSQTARIATLNLIVTPEVSGTADGCIVVPLKYAGVHLHDSPFFIFSLRAHPRPGRFIAKQKTLDMISVSVYVAMQTR